MGRLAHSTACLSGYSAPDESGGSPRRACRARCRRARGGRRLVAAPVRRELGVPVGRQRLRDDADQGEGHAQDQKGKTFTLAWTTDNESNPDDAIASNGSMDFA